ncbi:hypothetical protein BSKO_03105 [Bryopsis sp. KO-2023]|nr:hypothetical protein BSKO_03105 [Bryopsis sp. KO-2023]
MQAGTVFRKPDLFVCKDNTASSAAGHFWCGRRPFSSSSRRWPEKRPGARVLRSTRLCAKASDNRSSQEGPSLGDGVDLPSQGEAAVRGVDPEGLQVKEKEKKPVTPTGVDYLAELIAIQENGPKNIGFFGTRNMGFAHQQLVETLSYALVITGNHIYTSGATGTNAAVIRGALRAEKPDLLTVVLPQSLSKQPEDSRTLLKEVKIVQERSWNDGLSLYDASRLCNNEILNEVSQVICFAFHDSRLMLETCEDAKEKEKIVCLFFLD